MVQAIHPAKFERLVDKVLFNSEYSDNASASVAPSSAARSSQSKRSGRAASHYSRASQSK